MALKKFIVFGHIVAEKLPTSNIFVGDVEIRYQPNDERLAEPMRMHHANPSSPEMNFVSITPGHMRVYSPWRVGFLNVWASDEQDAYERVLGTRLPQFLTAYAHALGSHARVVITGIEAEPGSSLTPYSDSLTAIHVQTTVVNDDEVWSLASRAAETIAPGSEAFLAVKLLESAVHRLDTAGSIEILTASAALDAARSLEKIVQVVSRSWIKETSDPRNSDVARSALAKLERELKSDSEVKKFNALKRAASTIHKEVTPNFRSMANHAVSVLGLEKKLVSQAVGLWELRNNFLAHPSDIPPNIETKASRAVGTARAFVNGYISWVLRERQI